MYFMGISSNYSHVTQYNPVAPEGTQVAFLHQGYSAMQTVYLPVGSYYISMKAASGPDYDGLLGWPASVRVMDGTTQLMTTMLPYFVYSYQTINTPSFRVDTAGNHAFIFIGGVGATLLLDDVKIVSNNALPTVSITSPTNGQAFSLPATVTVEAVASDDVGVQSVQFYYDELAHTPLGQPITSPPYHYTLTHLPPGRHTITAKATDSSNATRFSTPITITVAPPSGYELLPTVTFSRGDYVHPTKGTITNAWLSSPSMDVPRGDDRSVVYAVNQTLSLSDYGAIGQHLSFRISLNDATSTANLFTGEPTHHFVVALNHRGFNDGTVSWGNRFAGATIGSACNADGDGKRRGIGIEWKDQWGQTIDPTQPPTAPGPTCISGIPPGTTSLIVDVTAMAGGCATVSVSTTTHEHLGSRSGCSGLGSDYAGLGVGAIGGLIDDTRYGVTVEPLDQYLIFPPVQ